MKTFLRPTLAVIGSVSFLFGGLSAASAATSPTDPGAAVQKSRTEKATIGSPVIIARPKSSSSRPTGSRKPMFWA